MNEKISHNPENENDLPWLKAFFGHYCETGDEIILRELFLENKDQTKVLERAQGLKEEQNADGYIFLDEQGLELGNSYGPAENGPAENKTKE